MTAKEVKQTILWHYNDAGVFALNKEEFEGLFSRFCEQLCREQKRLDSIAVDNESGYDGDTVNLRNALNAIANSPMPEL